jgi:pimeloyl-ACP methyl ester carboxylesterase
MNCPTDIPGYAYGTDDVARSAVSLSELEELKTTVGFTDEDERYLRLAGEVLGDQTKQVVERWRSGIIASIPNLARHSRSPEGIPLPEYLAKSNQRFEQWILDTCLRPYDQTWLDYLFYREAGDPQKPTVLLLHGFPTSSHMFRNLIPQLAGDFHVIAPDLPGFGFSDAPGHDVFQYTFANVAKVMGDFVEQLGLKKFAIYIFDYGAPTGLRMALRFPERISAIITQNGNAYVDGLSKDWAPVQTYWEKPTQENRDALRKLQTLDTTRWQYYHGVTNPEERIAPEAILLDQTLLDRPQSGEIQLDLIGDYKTNVELGDQESPSRRRWMEQPRSSEGLPGLFHRQLVAQPLRICRGPRSHRSISDTQMETRARLSPDQGTLGIHRKSHRGALRLRMA